MALRADDVNLGRDRVLVEMFQSGDSRAFEDLYTRYFQRIYRFCLKRVGDPHEAEELAQEAFTRAFSAMPRLGGDRRFYPWLTVIASRLCVDTHRRRGRTSPSDEIELGVVDGGQEAILEDADRQLLTQALARVNPRHREVLHLREREGWSYEKIANHLDVRVGTIEALLFRARRALRREFLNLAGADSRLAGLPVIGWAVRRLIETRGRIADVASQAAPLFAAGVVSVAVVAAAGAIGNPAQQAARPQAQSVVGTPVVQMPALNVTGAGRADAAAVSNASATKPAARGVTGSPLGPGAENLGFTSNDSAKAQADSMPVHVTVGGVTLGVDPSAELSDLLPKGH